MKPEQSVTGRAARWGFWTAAILGCLGLVTIWISPVVGLAHAALFGAIAWGIRRGRSWAAIAGLGVVISPVIVVGLRLASADVREPGQSGAFLVSLALAVLCGYFLLRAAAELWPRTSGVAAAGPWITIIALVAAGWVFFQPLVIPSAAMQDTLLAGDHLVVETASALAGRAPQRGDIVVIHYPIDRRQTFVKRIVGVPGDRLRIVNKQLYRNGAPIAEPYAVHKTDYVDNYRDNFPGVPNIRLYPPAEAMLKDNVRDGEVVVPEGKYFVLGDNRDSSLDSRYWGFVTRTDIIGRPVLIYASYDVGESLPDSGQILSIRNTRWNRLLKRPGRG